MSIKVLEFILLSVLLAYLFMPVDARINFNYTLNYDHDGTSQYFGEEIRVKLVIDPGANEVRDMRIDILEDEALIDDTSFEEAKYPAGAPVNITRVGHTFFCDRLGVGESIALMFNAYPKTERVEKIKVADVIISYTQLGERVKDEEELKANMSNSSWFKYVNLLERVKSLESEIGSIQMLFNIGILFIILAIFVVVISVFILWTWRRKTAAERENIREEFHNKLKEISKGLDRAEGNPSEVHMLRRKVERYIKEYEKSGR